MPVGPDGSFTATRFRSKGLDTRTSISTERSSQTESSVTTGERFLVERDALNSDGFQDFLDRLSSAYSQSLNVLVLDNGQFHKANRLTIPENVRLLFLPPYSPELNPIERFWEDVKDHLAFHLHKRLSELKERVSEKLHSYTDEAVASLTGYQYLVDASNAQSS